jgi:hypothetical protein
MLDEGLCFAQWDYAGAPAYRLGPAEMSPSEDWPAGLPRPMALQDGAGRSTPWRVSPARARRLAEDFTLPADREKILALFDETNPNNLSKDGFDGVFFYDVERGEVHGFSPLSWTIVHAQDGSSAISMPVREVETRLRYNFPESPNCAGAYRATALDPATQIPCTSQGSNPAWGCKDEGCPLGESPVKTTSYSLITDLEQIFSEDLEATLCVTYRGQNTMESAGFYNPDTKSCRSAKWNPAAPGNAGIPRGDWCAATNSSATDTCHDAWRNGDFHVYAGAKLRLDPLTDEPSRCER